VGAQETNRFWQAMSGMVRTGIHAQDMKKPAIQNILVPIDFSRSSIEALRAANTLARQFSAAIHLGHVYLFGFPSDWIAVPAALPDWAPSVDENPESRLKAKLREVAQSFGVAETHCHLRNGTPLFDQICRLARDIHADLIVTATHGYKGIKHLLLGSTAERLVQHAPCPVFVCRGIARKIGKVLVPVDFSSCSLGALNYAIGFANSAGAKIIVFHALDLSYAHTADGYVMYDCTALTIAAQKEAERQMREFITVVKFGGVKFGTAIRVGMPVDEICGFAADEDVDLIITATHGRTGFKHVLIGSVAENVVRHADRAVLVVPSHAHKRAKDLTRRAKRARALPRSIPLTTATKQTPRQTERYNRIVRTRARQH
jgi:nucleotide-binding universal stress UspA family protein